MQNLVKISSMFRIFDGKRNSAVPVPCYFEATVPWYFDEQT